MQKMKFETTALSQKNVAKIAELFPNCVTEKRSNDGTLKNAVDFDMLKQMLSDDIVDAGDEAYQFTWVGKKAAMVEANKPIRKTLRPCQAESKDWDTTENLYIEGDNLEVLKLLQESYLGKVKMIYIDPPYNTGNDFIYNDDFKINREDYQLETGEIDDAGNRLFKNTDSNGRFHSDWCSMIYARLMLARNLLSDDGVIFISIDDNEQANLKKLCDEVFGEKNFVGCAGRISKKSNNKGEFWAPNFDYLITYVKDINIADSFFGGVNYKAYKLVDKCGARAGEYYQLVRLYMSTIKNRNPEQRYYIECPDGTKVIPPGSTFPPERPNLGDGIWRWTRKKFEAEKDKIVIKKVKSSNLINEDGNKVFWNVFTKTYLNDVIDNSSAKPNSFIEGFINQKASHELNDLDIPFDYAKPSDFIKFLLEISKSNGNSIVMDFFSGSATTAHAVMKLNAEDGGNRKFIMVQLPEQTDEKSEAYKAGYQNICEIGKERIRRSGEKIKADYKEKTDIEQLDTGFRVLKLADSNMKDVYFTPDQYEQLNLDGFESNIKEDRTELDLLFGCLIVITLVSVQ